MSTSNIDIKSMIYPSTEEEVITWRLSRKKGIVLKIKEKIYLVKPEMIKSFPVKRIGKHLCSKCENLSPLKCLKVYDKSSVSYCRAETKDSKRLEKYPFIKLGIEVFNCGTSENFIVCKCKNFKRES